MVPAYCHSAFQSSAYALRGAARRFLDSFRLSILDEQGLPRYRALCNELAEVERVNERVRRDVVTLRRDVDDLRTDPDAIGRIARDELGMIRAGEILFQFPN